MEDGRSPKRARLGEEEGAPVAAAPPASAKAALLAAAAREAAQHAARGGSAAVAAQPLPEAACEADAEWWELDSDADAVETDDEGAEAEEEEEEDADGDGDDGMKVQAAASQAAPRNDRAEAAPARAHSAAAAPPPALHALLPGGTPAAPTPRVASASAAPAAPPLPPAATRFDAPAWDAGARDFAVGAPASGGGSGSAGGGGGVLPPLVASLASLGERPVMPLDARARVPRATRQTVLDKFLERALCRVASCTPGGEGAVMAPTERGAAARKHAVEEARAEEAALYGKSASKAIFLNLAAQAMRAPPPAPTAATCAVPQPSGAAAAVQARGRAPKVHAPPLRVPVRAASPEALRALLARCSVVRSAAATAFFSEVVAARAHSLSLLWTPPFYAPRAGERVRTAVPAQAAPPDAAGAAEEEERALAAADAALPPPPPLPPLPPPPPLPATHPAALHAQQVAAADASHAPRRIALPQPAQQPLPPLPLPPPPLPLPPPPPLADEVDAWTDALLHGVPQSSSMHAARLRDGAAFGDDALAQQHARVRASVPAAAPGSPPGASALDARLATIGAAAIRAGPARRPPTEPRRSAKSGGAGASSSAPAACSAVREGVRACVRAYLDPLFHAGALTRDEYRDVARRASEKVCDRHAAARDASFLQREASRVHALLREYIRRGRAQAGGAAGGAASPPDRGANDGGAND
jgi:hypothetical protein